MAHRQTIAATTQVVTADEAKTHCRIDLSAEDLSINSWIQAATDLCQNITHRSFLSSTWVQAMDSFYDCRYVTGGRIYMLRPPLLAVSSIQYVDSAGDTQTLAADQYRVDAQNQPGRIEPAYGVTWPTTQNVVNAVTITHTAGYGITPASVPASIRHAVLLLVGHWSANREAVGTMTKEIEFGVMSLLGPYIMEPYA